MKKVYSSDNYIMAGHIHSLLEANDISCHLKNMSLTGGIGELPINECWPEVWVNNESDYRTAERLIETALAQNTGGEPWKCQCGEIIEGQFDTCWSCGKLQSSS